jgi:hypothetical protein
MAIKGNIKIISFYSTLLKTLFTNPEYHHESNFTAFVLMDECFRKMS